MKLTEKQYHALLDRAPRVGAVDINVWVCDPDGTVQDAIQPGRFVCAESYYGATMSYVTPEMTLIPCEIDDEE